MAHAFGDGGVEAFGTYTFPHFAKEPAFYFVLLLLPKE